MVMNVNIDGRKEKVRLRISSGSGSTHLVVLPKSSRDLDILRQVKIQNGIGDEEIGTAVAKMVEKKIKLPAKFDYGYRGYGYGLKFDLYSIAKMLN